MKWYLEAWRKYITFHGRATRTEFWCFILIHTLIIFVLAMIDYFVWGSNSEYFSSMRELYISAKSLTWGLDSEYIFGLLVFVYLTASYMPYLTVKVRRLHDSNHSGWWILLEFIPVAGWIVILALLLLAGTPGNNRFGNDPREAKSKPN